jgi:hypothetical protein
VISDFSSATGSFVGMVLAVPSLYDKMILSAKPWMTIFGSNPMIDVSASSSGPVNDSNRNVWV